MVTIEIILNIFKFRTTTLHKRNYNNTKVIIKKKSVLILVQKLLLLDNNQIVKITIKNLKFKVISIIKTSSGALATQLR